MTSALHFLSQRLAQSLARHACDEQGVVLPLPQFTTLTQSAQQVAAQFEPGKEAEPPEKMRREAIAKLRGNESALSGKDWKLISWGLSDTDDKAGCLLDDDVAFNKVHRYVNEQISTTHLSRKLWFGLSFSYFAYGNNDPKTNPNWLSLQRQIRAGFNVLANQQQREHAWSRVVANNVELFELHAGQQLGLAIFDGNNEQVQQVQEYLPIPENSWLWQRIIKEQLNQLFTIQDHEFRPRIDGLLAQAQQFPRYTNEILAAVLDRYASAIFRGESHSALKDFALATWESPQLKSAQNKWATYVKDDVCKMVLRWFAKEDLEHFFKLLQGESGVDEARLHYWLRFVDQMNYTRIVLGADARYERASDFVDFRQKNSARLSYLSSAPKENNAFIMQIGEYYVVEFSGKGNASFIYRTPPFNPDAKNLDLNDLKQKPPVAVERLLHMHGWEQKFDIALYKLGITTEGLIKNNLKAIPQSKIAMPTAFAPRPHGVKHAASASSSATSQVIPLHITKQEAAIEQAKLLLSTLPTKIVTDDRRGKGGAFWIITHEDKNELATQLRRLGFGFVPSKGFWIK